jgi:hypothetical protein
LPIADESTETRERARSRQEGAAEAEAADLRLRLEESLERERRLIERTLEAEESWNEALADEHQLRTQIAAYAAFHRAVERSGAWRVIQFARSLFGRRW